MTLKERCHSESHGMELTSRCFGKTRHKWRGMVVWPATHKWKL